MTRVLLLTVEERRPNIDPVFRELALHVDLETVVLAKQKKMDFRKELKSRYPGNYDALLLDLPFRRSSMYYKYLRKLDKVFIYEEDSCQDLIPDSRWHGKFSKAYKKIPGVRVINTGYQVSRHLAGQGVNASPLFKGFDSGKLYNEDLERDIELGFVGRVKSKAYSARRELLESMSSSMGLQMMMTEPGDAYRAGLNRISIFLSADIGLHEYMAKNSEAMACGCCVLAYRQGEGEEQWLGLRDMENIVLYDSRQEAEEKVNYLRENPQKREEIARAGMELAQARFTYKSMGQGLAALLKDND